MGGVSYGSLSTPGIDGAPTIVRLPKKVKPEDITIDDLRHLSNESFALWTQTSGATVDGNVVDFSSHRYLFPIYMCNDQEVVWQKAAQMGATVYMLLRLIHWLHTHQGRKAGLYFPTKEGVDNLSKDRLTPLLQSIPELNGTIDDNDKLGLRKLGKSSFYLFHLGGTASKDSVPLDFVAFDEVRLCRPADIDQALERISHSPFKQKIFMSTCGMPENDIAARFDLGTQHIWMSKCFVGDTKLWVREKSTGKVFTKRIDELDNCEQYQALSVSTQNKKQVWRDITALHKNGVRKVSKLTYGNGTTVTCTPDHRFAWVSRKTLDTISYVEAKDILGTYRNGKYQRNNLLTVSGVFAESTQLGEQAPYDNLTLAVIGAFIAEGSWKTSQSINISQLEGKHLHQLVQTWAEANNLTHNPTSTGVDISLVSRPDLISLFAGCGKGCENKRIPECLLSVSTKQAKYILDGYLSGDGCRHDISPDSRHTPRGLKLLLDTSWEATTTSETLAYQLKDLALRAGYYTSIRSDKVSEGKKPSWSISYHTNSTRVHFQLNEELHTTSIVSCVDAGEAEVYDITVDAIEDRNHNFVLANGAVVHNCGCPDGCDLARTFPDCVVDDKKRGKLYLRCPKCRYVINDTQNGRYVAHNPGADYTSFHVSQLASKYMPLKFLWDFYHRTTNKAEFFNAKLGLPFIDEENRGVTLGQLKSCIDPNLEWAQPGKAANTAMGVDVGGGYCYVVIADLHESKKRIRHVEIIEADNPHYMENGKRNTPFKRLRELIKEYKVQLCVIDAMPNYDMVLELAQDYPGKVFASFYAKEAKDVVNWSDRPRTKVSLKKAGPLLKFKYYCVLSRYLSLDVALAQWADNDIICPDPDRLVQMCFDERTKELHPEAVMNRAFSMFMRLVKRFNVTNEETGEGRHEWIYSGGDPHFAHAFNYCNIALERLRRSMSFSFV